MALLWIIIGATFDFFDGMSARLLHVSSPIGKELDSLADDVTFGVAPATIVFSQLLVMEYPEFWSLCDHGCLMQPSSSQPSRHCDWQSSILTSARHTSFIGVPTPANALFWGSLMSLNPSWLDQPVLVGISSILALILITSYLLVCELPLFALKFKQWSFKGNEVKYGFTALHRYRIGISHLSQQRRATGFLQAWWLIILVYVLHHCHPVH